MPALLGRAPQQKRLPSFNTPLVHDCAPPPSGAAPAGRARVRSESLQTPGGGGCCAATDCRLSVLGAGRSSRSRSRIPNLRIRKCLFESVGELRGTKPQGKLLNLELAVSIVLGAPH
mmetsp:Transcript_24588/g.69889  ORF Transcript_24588/g.69889 Transcript_24588/m.69889 type:complete len:117 (+) Transcript_24588:88-438(+)